MKYVLSYGGGINSSALFFYLLAENKPLDLVIFADTGEEEPKTMKSVAAMQRICEKKAIPFVIVKSKYGNLYDHYYKKKAVMSLMRRDCTGKFKVSPIRQYLRSTYGKQEKFVIYIGIAWEEMHRMKESNVKYIVQSYPFIENRIDRSGNKKILKDHAFIASKSGCKGCLYLKRKQWVKMIIENRDEFERHMKLEENNSGFPKILLNGQYSLRSLLNSFKNQKSLKDFDDIEPSCDVSGSCFL